MLSFDGCLFVHAECPLAGAGGVASVAIPATRVVCPRCDGVDAMGVSEPILPVHSFSDGCDRWNRRCDTDQLDREVVHGAKFAIDELKQMWQPTGDAAASPVR